MYKVTLEKANSQLLRILDADGNGAVVAETEVKAETLTDAMVKASAWAEASHMDLANNTYARYPVRFLGVSAFGGNYGLGYASRRYRRGGRLSNQGGFLLFVKEASDATR